MKYRLLTILALGFISLTSVAQNTTTYRDNLGRKTRTSETNSRGETVYRDALGRRQGTSSRK